MRSKRKWKNDELIETGDEVLLRKETDANKKTKKFPLYDHIDTNAYKIINKKKDLYSLVNDKGITFKNVHRSRIKKIER